MNSHKIILGFDPGRDKCGVAVLTKNLTLHYHQVVTAENAIAKIGQLISQFEVELIVMGNLTTSQSWHDRLKSAFADLPVEMVNEQNSTLEARDRYWQMYPPQGFQKLIPQSLRLPPRPIDDIVAILLIERYLSANS